MVEAAVVAAVRWWNGGMGSSAVAVAVAAGSSAVAVVEAAGLGRRWIVGWHQWKRRWSRTVWRKGGGKGSAVTRRNQRKKKGQGIT